VDPRQLVIAYCTSPEEQRSARVVQRLHQRGYRNVRILKGGLGGWTNAFLGAIWSSTTAAALAKPTIAALWILSLGALSAAAFHLFRYQASMRQQDADRTWTTFRSLYFGSAVVSLLCFFVGISVLALCAWNALGRR